MLEALGTVYDNDALAREQGLDAEQRLPFHQQYSAPLMGSAAWMAAGATVRGRTSVRRILD